MKILEEEDKKDYKMFATNPFISERFEKSVLLHIAKNYLPNNRYVPLILGVHGPSGEGKSFQLEFVLKKHNIKTFLISGGQLESPHAGMPAQTIRNKYIAAGHSLNEDDKLCSALIINDIDAGVGDWGELVQTTINTQNVYAELMNLVDEPYKVSEFETSRIPIIVTGNDFSKLYAPLVRAGRMASFEWIPTSGERVRILQGIFPEYSKEELNSFYNELIHKVNPKVLAFLTTSFYSYLRSTLYDELIWDKLKNNVPETIQSIINGDRMIFPNLNISIDELLDKAVFLAETSHLSNHLKISDVVH